MGCGKCCKSKCLCPFSLGMAIGLTCALGVMFWHFWGAYMGSVPAMVHMEPAASFSEAGINALWALGRGFVAGVVVALIYDMVACMCKGKCCKKSDDNGSCSK